jgi:hypothetical protein
MLLCRVESIIDRLSQINLLIKSENFLLRRKEGGAILMGLLGRSATP